VSPGTGCTLVSRAGVDSWTVADQGFLAGANSGLFQGIFRSLAGVPEMDWLFMAGLLGVGLAFIFGVAIRPVAVSGAVMLAL